MTSLATCSTEMSLRQSDVYSESVPSVPTAWPITDCDLG